MVGACFASFSSLPHHHRLPLEIEGGFLATKAIELGNMTEGSGAGAGESNWERLAPLSLRFSRASWARTDG